MMLRHIRLALVRLIAAPEVATLERYRLECVAMAHTLKRFPDAADTLWHLYTVAEGKTPSSAIGHLAERLVRRAAGLRSPLEDLAQLLRTSPLGAEPPVTAADRWAPAGVPVDVAERRRAGLEPTRGVHYESLGVCGDEG